MDTIYSQLKGCGNSHMFSGEGSPGFVMYNGTSDKETGVTKSDHSVLIKAQWTKLLRPLYRTGLD